MSQSTKRCPKCSGKMVRGFLIDNTGQGQYVQHWAEGQAQKSFWKGTTFSGEAMPVGAFRCKSCGYLESYAGPEFAAQ